MQYINVNVYNKYIFDEEKDDNFIRNFHLASSIFKTNYYSRAIEEEIMTQVLITNGDGIDIKINTIKNLHYINIFIIQWDNKFEIEKDSYYVSETTEKILKWFSTTFESSNEDELLSAVNFGDIYSNSSGFCLVIDIEEDWDKGELILQEIKQLELESRVLRHSRNSFNCGASGFGEEIIIWIAGKFGDAILEKIKKRFKQGDSYSISYSNLDIIYDHIIDNLGESRIHLELQGLREIENGDIEYKINTRYREITVICDKKSKIKSQIVKSKTKTLI
jgi:hypothetical protein